MRADCATMPAVLGVAEVPVLGRASEVVLYVFLIPNADVAPVASVSLESGVVGREGEKALVKGRGRRREVKLGLGGSGVGGRL